MLRKSNRAARTPPSTTRNGAHISTRPGHGHPADDTTAVEAATIPATWRSACIDVGYGVAGALAGDTAVASLPDPSPADVIDAVGDHLRSGRGVLAIHPAWRDDLARTLDTACCSLDTDLLVVHASTLPPLAAAVLIAQMGALAANGVGLGHLASALPLVEKSILPIGWLRSVTRLAHPATSMRHHVR